MEKKNKINSFSMTRPNKTKIISGGLVEESSNSSIEIVGENNWGTPKYRIDYSPCSTKLGIKTRSKYVGELDGSTEFSKRNGSGIYTICLGDKFDFNSPQVKINSNFWVGNRIKLNTKMKITYINPIENRAITFDFGLTDKDKECVKKLNQFFVEKMLGEEASDVRIFNELKEIALEIDKENKKKKEELIKKENERKEKIKSENRLNEKKKTHQLDCVLSYFRNLYPSESGSKDTQKFELKNHNSTLRFDLKKNIVVLNNKSSIKLDNFLDLFYNISTGIYNRDKLLKHIEVKKQKNKLSQIEKLFVNELTNSLRQNSKDRGR